MRMTHSTVEVAMAIMEDPNGRHHGYELSKRSGVRSGVLYPILSRMLAEGLLTDTWEEPDSETGRPRRRYYDLTEAGRGELGAMLSAASVDRRFAHRFGAQPGTVALARMPRLAWPEVSR